MAHILSRLRNVPLAKITEVLKEHAKQHAEHGLYLEHIWQNADDQNEVIFLFKAENLDRAKQFINKMHTQALKEDPNANLPKMTFLG